MSAHFVRQQTLDVIAQFNRDGSIIPLKIRLYDEDGELQSYVIKAVRERYVNSAPADYNIIIFDCKINAFGHDRIAWGFAPLQYHPRFVLISLCSIGCIYTSSPLQSLIPSYLLELPLNNIPHLY